MGEETKIDAAEMRTAVGTCIKDPALQRLFRFAPDGAREVFKLSFYSTVFPEKMDAHRFRGCLRAIEPELTSEDLRYLIRFEDDPRMKAWFAKLLAEREKGEAGGSPAQDLPAGPKLHVRRDVVSRPAVDLNAEAMKRNLRQSELDKQKNAERAAASRREASVDALLKTGVVVAVGLAILVGGISWLRVRSKRQQERAEAARAAEERAEELEVVQETLERVERERRQAAHRDQRLKEQAAEQAERAAERAKRMAEQEKRDKEVALRERQNEEARMRQNEIAKRFSGFRSAFSGASLFPWGSLPRAQRPGAVEGTFLCLVPDAQGRGGCYEVQSQTNGAVTVVQLTREQGCAEVNPGEWNRRLETFGGLVHNGRSAYLFLPKQTAGESLCPREDIRPSQMRLGALESTIREMGMNTERIAFEVRLRVPGETRAEPVDVVKFGEYVFCHKIKQKIRDLAAAKVMKEKPKKFRRTLMLYDGNVTKRQINGITLLPRNPPRVTKQYLAMREEAERQEAELAEWRNGRIDEKTDGMLDSARVSIVVSSPELLDTGIGSER